MRPVEPEDKGRLSRWCYATPMSNRCMSPQHPENHDRVYECSGGGSDGSLEYIPLMIRRAVGPLVRALQSNGA